MTNREIALKFLYCFCAADLDGLASLLAPDLQFRGTLHHYRSAEAYLEALRNDPPDRCGCHVLSVTEGGDAVAVFYEYRKPKETLVIAQLVRIRQQRISEVLVVFDAGNTGPADDRQ
jgi:hypothetical protein